METDASLIFNLCLRHDWSVAELSRQSRVAYTNLAAAMAGERRLGPRSREALERLWKMPRSVSA
jgi:hypothetical protein